MKIAIFTLFQNEEIDGTISAIKMLKNQLDKTSTHLFVLGNGVGESNLGAMADLKSESINIYTSEDNLGVAGGRNFLINKIKEDYDADIYISLDNDIIIPDNYCRFIANSFQQIREEFIKEGKPEKKVGVIAPLVIQGTELENLQLKNYNYPDEQELLDSVFETYFDRGNKGVIYHAGIKGWVTHYLSNPGSMILIKKIYSLSFEPFIKKIFKLKCQIKTPTTFMAHDEMYMYDLLKRRIPTQVDTLSGGLHCFEKDFIQEIGLYDNQFNPFGYEDADFCIRGLKKYYSNFVIPALMVIHDVDRRYISRPYSEKLKVIARCKKKLILNFVKNPLALIIRYLDFLLLYPLAIRADLRKSNKVMRWSHIKIFWKNFL